jgi:hypothetical protein
MQNKIEIFNNQVIINYNLAYPKSREVLLKSHTFAKFVQYFIEYQETDNANMYAYLTKNGELSSKEAAYDFCHFLRLLSIFTCEELKDEYYLSDKLHPELQGRFQAYHLPGTQDHSLQQQYCLHTQKQ